MDNRIDYREIQLRIKNAAPLVKREGNVGCEVGRFDLFASHENFLLLCDALLDL